MGKRVGKHLAVWAIVAASALAASSPEVAYTRNDVLYLVTVTGEVVRTVKVSVPIANFAVSPDLSRIIFVPRSHNGYGGSLQVVDTKTDGQRSLSRGPYWPPVPKGARREVYADPTFSPDGSAVAFAIRDVPRSGGTDMVEASGPLAVMDPATGRTRLLQATLNVQGEGPAFANEPHWSPDGAQILVSFETGFAVVSADGKKLNMLSPAQLPANYDWSTALGWLGNRCVLFGIGHSGVVERVEILHLSSMKTEEASQRFGFALGNRTGIERVQMSGSLLLVGTKTESQLFDIASGQLVSRFPAGAKLVGPTRRAVSGCE
jgi:hypothetical protein